MNSHRYKISASIVCGNMLNLESDIRQLEKGKADSIHFDVMDGQFVPRLGLHPEILQQIKSITSIPVDVHLMIENPEAFVPLFAESGADIITVHAEATSHLHRAVTQIRKLGKKAGVALNPATSLNVLDYVLDDIDLVLLMAINPGILGHKLIPSALKKIEDTKAKLKNHPHVEIEIDGGVTFESAADMVRRGATMLVCGSSTIFKPEIPIDQKIFELRNTIDTHLK